jgi:hypothetical protein
MTLSATIVPVTSNFSTSTPGESIRLEALRLELRDYLADTRQAIDDEIRCYPKPIPRCDAQFNFLYEQRSRVAQLIERVDSASNPEASRRELIDVVEDFVNSTPLLESPRERELRERLKEHIT